jgi:hypothetical protein
MTNLPLGVTLVRGSVPNRPEYVHLCWPSVSGNAF